MRATDTTAADAPTLRVGAAALADCAGVAGGDASFFELDCETRWAHAVIKETNE